MSIKTYQFFCDHCGFKKVTDGSDIGGLREIKQSPVPRDVPTLDPLAKKNVAVQHGQPADVTTGTRQQPAFKQKKKFKCPKCGYVIQARQIRPEEYDVPTNRTDGSEAGFTGPSLPGELT
jgi:predicted RNA-binding Zn-ribbon protein involved in translation (DUF1610 family)